jgi:hypothetical protein
MLMLQNSCGVDCLSFKMSAEGVAAPSRGLLIFFLNIFEAYGTDKKLS